MKKNIFFLLVIVISFVLCFSACEGDGISIKLNTDTSTDDFYTDTDASTESKDSDSDSDLGEASTDINTDTGTENSGNQDAAGGDGVPEGGEIIGGGDDGEKENGESGGDGQNDDSQGEGNRGDDNNEENDNQGGTNNDSGVGGEVEPEGSEIIGGSGDGNTESGEAEPEGGEIIGGSGDGNTESGEVEPEGDEAVEGNGEIYTDAEGFVFLNENGELYCIDFVRPVDATRIVYMPSEYQGMPVVGIRANAFADFGTRFGESPYKNTFYNFIIAIPTSIKVVEASSFEKCSGMRIALYVKEEDACRLLDSIFETDLIIILEWESNLILFDKTEKYTRQARDTIWGFRPALGWTRYSHVEIPDYYE